MKALRRSRLLAIEQRRAWFEFADELLSWFGILALLSAVGFFVLVFGGRL